jgi:xylan 1,4-beta-xylosidase
MRKSFFIHLLACLLCNTLQLQAQRSDQQTYCNPMDIGYRYNWEQINKNISYRSGADPVIINHKSEYYLFVTISGGYWRSTDLINWKYITPSRWPMEDMCAPAALSVRDTLYLFQSTFEQRPIFYTTTPETGKLSFYNRWLPQLPKEVGPWDPALFYDEELNKWYMYWGSSNVYPLYGAELDKTKSLTYKSDYKPMLLLYPDKHGWERFGLDHRDTIKPYMEGAWMTKFKNKYYLQYGAPGTEYNVYANGTYESSDPLGPFTYANYNPISYKPGGFVTGAGHGNTFQDNYGNWWNTGTPWVAVNWNFERRIAMFPGGFTNEGEMHFNTRFGDLPHYMPKKSISHNESLFTGWMLLSYKKNCLVSSLKDDKHANNVNDENPRTYWVAATNKSGEWLQMDLGAVKNVKAFQVNYTDYQSNLYDNDERVYLQFKMYGSKDAKQWQVLYDNSSIKEDRPNAYIELEKSADIRYIKFENVYVPTPNLAISDLRVFGNSLDKLPITPTNVKAVRQTDTRNADISWQDVRGATGYNILWGVAPDKLFQTYQVWGDQPTKLEVRALTVGQTYYFAIETFNEKGVSQLSKVLGPI